MTSQTYRINEPDVISQLFGEEVVAIHLPTGTYHSLTGSGSDIFWALSLGCLAKEQITEYVAGKYRVPCHSVAQDVTDYLALLDRHSLIVAGDGAATANLPPAGSDPAVAYLPPALQSHDDLQTLFLLDPVHDVSTTGWPNLPTTAGPSLDLLTSTSYECQIAGTHIVFERFPDETVVVNTANGAYCSLYGPAEDIFLLLARIPTLQEILKALESKYLLTGIDVERHVREFLRALETAGLLTASPVVGEGGAVRELPLERPGSSLPFSVLSLQAFAPQGGPSPLRPAPAPTAQPLRYLLRPQNLLISATADGLVMADREYGFYYSLNQPAAAVLQQLRRGATMAALVGHLSALYEVPQRDLSAAIMIFIGNLMQMSLLSTSESDGELPAVAPDPDIQRKPFPGFDLAVHRDLIDLLAPFNHTEPARSDSQQSSPPDATQLLEVLRSNFERAGSRNGIAESSFRIGDSTICLRRVGDGGAELEQAWSHLRVPAAPGAAPGADLVIQAWTGGGSRDFFLDLLFDKLGLEWNKICGPRGELLEFHCPETAVIYHPGPDVLSVLDHQRGVAYFVKRESTPLPYWEIGSPFRYILHSWFAARGLQFVHGAAVAGDSGGVLLAGKGGAGKSTTALLCARAGMRYAGDDYCLVDPETAVLYSLYNTAKLKGHEDLARVPDVAGLSLNDDGFEQGGDGKAIFFLADLWPERLASQFPLRAILIPQVADQKESRLEPCSSREALAALMPSTVAQLPAANDSDCERLARLAERLPAYVLHLGSDLPQIPALVRQICS